MEPSRARTSLASVAIVCGVASIVGVVLGRAASAGDSTPAPSASPLAPKARPLAATAAPKPAASHDIAESEEDIEAHEAHAADAATPAPSSDIAPSPTSSPPLVAPPSIRVPEKDSMLRVPGGRITLAGASNRASRVRDLAPYWIDRFEVTVGEYRACVDAEKCARPKRMSARCTYDLDDPKLPISCVHWADADAFCRSHGKRLPAEAEWELAARGGTGGAFPWGNALTCRHAVTMTGAFFSLRSCAPHPLAVGSHPAGASMFGVQDMIGNVSEWTDDWYAERSAGPAPRTGTAHVLRGGGWLTEPQQARTSVRDWASAVEAGPNVGFRCARDDR